MPIGGTRRGEIYNHRKCPAFVVSRTRFYTVSERLRFRKKFQASARRGQGGFTPAGDEKPPYVGLRMELVGGRRNSYQVGWAG